MMNCDGMIARSPHSIGRATTRFQKPRSSPYAPWCVHTTLTFVRSLTTQALHALCRDLPGRNKVRKGIAEMQHSTAVTRPRVEDSDAMSTDDSDQQKRRNK
jgi:hypothetical protein